MQYKLITTKKGQVPIEEIEEGTEVLSMGKWVVSPKPIKDICLKCYFDSLPTTIFEKKFATCKKTVSVNHKPIIAETKDFKIELSIRGYFRRNFDRKINRIHILDDAQLVYWYPRFIRIFGETGKIGLHHDGCNLHFYKNLKFKELCGEELTMRNLEYYLEGMLRRTFFEHRLHFCIKSDLDESDKIVLRLLDIDCRKGALGYDIIDNVSILKHIKDDYNKSKVTEQMIVSSLKRSLIVPQYTSEHNIIKKEEIEDWVLPGINPDINCLNPLNCYEKGASENRHVYTSRIENSIFSKIFEK